MVKFTCLSVLVSRKATTKKEEKSLNNVDGKDEHDEDVTTKSGFSNHGALVNPSELCDQSKKMNIFCSFNGEPSDQFNNRADRDAEDRVDMIQNGYVSDTGTAESELWKSPRLTRSCSNLGTGTAESELWKSPRLTHSCSNLGTRAVLKRISDNMLLSKSQCSEEMQRLTERMTAVVLPGSNSSPCAVTTCQTADKVMLKECSSSQNSFLSTLHEPRRTKQLLVNPPLNQQGRYSSDTIETNRGTRFVSEITFATDSSSPSMDRVEKWLKDISSEPDDDIAFPRDTGKLPAKSSSQLIQDQDMNLPQHFVNAKSVIQSLHSSSTIAHMAGRGLKFIPAIWRFSSLRCVNLSANYIVSITPGSLPKGLYTLNLSRNKLSTIEGLKELTRLRVLDLNYNRISRIGQGLSNCTLIKEIYLAGNKISDLQGLHRLLKLTILDLSFNKITTMKSLGQIVANYNSLVALNLLGNPIQNNVSDGQLRKEIYGLLPKLAYLNKQPINPQKARAMVTESIAKAAIGNSDKGIRRRDVKKMRQGGSSVRSTKRNVVVTQKSKHRLKSRTYQRSPLRTQ